MNNIENGTFFRGDAMLPDLPAGKSDGGADAEVPTQARGAFPRFFLDKVEAKAESGFAYRDVERVEVLIPGDVKSVVMRKVSDADRLRWPAHYEAFKRGRELATTGTPLEFWGGLSPAQLATLKFHNVRSVENLADLSDAQLQAVGMGMRALQARAAAWLAQAKDGGHAQKLAAENQALRDDLAAKDEQIRALATRLEALEQKPSKLATPEATTPGPTANPRRATKA